MTEPRPVVVVVDDDPGMGRAIGRMVELAGMSPIVYASAEAMLETPPERMDCVVVDVHLPGMDGLQLCEQVPAGTPVLLMSASEEAEERVRALPGEPRAFLAKPFGAQAMLAALERLLGEADRDAEPPRRRRYL